MIYSNYIILSVYSNFKSFIIDFAHYVEPCLSIKSSSSWFKSLFSVFESPKSLSLSSGNLHIFFSFWMPSLSSFKLNLSINFFSSSINKILWAIAKGIIKFQVLFRIHIYSKMQPHVRTIAFGCVYLMDAHCQLYTKNGNFLSGKKEELHSWIKDDRKDTQSSRSWESLFGSKTK